MAVRVPWLSSGQTAKSSAAQTVSLPSLTSKRYSLYFPIATSSVTSVVASPASVAMVAHAPPPTRCLTVIAVAASFASVQVRVSVVSSIRAATFSTGWMTVFGCAACHIDSV